MQIYVNLAYRKVKSIHVRPSTETNKQQVVCVIAVAS
jgi:hypothetical protein